MSDRSGKLYFGVSNTDKEDQVKEVIIRNPGELIEGKLDVEIGDELIVKFSNGNSNSAPQLLLKINDQSQDIEVTGEIPTITISENPENIDIITTPGYYEWDAQQLIGFVYVYGDQISDGESTNEVYYWKAFQIDKATDIKYGVTKVINNVELLEDNGDQPVGWDVITGYIDDSLLSLELGYNSSTGTISAKRPIDPSPATVNIPVITRTSQLQNDGELPDSPNGAVYIENVNPWIRSTGDGLGYRVNINNVETHIPNFIPHGVSAGNQVLWVGRGSMNLYQNGNKSEGIPRAWIYGQNMRLGIDALDIDTGDDVSKLEIGGVDLPGGHWYPWYTFKKSGAVFEKPLRLNDGLKIGNVPIKNYVDNEVENHPFRLFHYAWIESAKLTYNANSSVPTISSPTSGYATVHHNKGSGNLWMNITDISGYTPLIVRAWNVNESTSGSADDFYVWECYLDITNKQLQFGLKNTSNKKLSCRFKGYILYVKNGGYFNNYGNVKKD